MRTVKGLFFAHLGALVFGLAGLLIALPHPELWSENPTLGVVFSLGIRYAGSLHIVLGAATILLFGLFCVGVRKTLIFFAISTTLSLSMELLGTSTGFPFGPYAYTDFLGYKLLNHVPFSIPLSWFYMGFTAYLLAQVLVTRAGWRRRTLWSLLFGAFFLTVWDLSLDPAMASPQLPIHFWIWSEVGPYFGMPIRNLVGWTLTGLAYMSISRLLWRENTVVERLAAWLPFGVYAANTGFAIVLTLAVGIWQPLFIATLLGLLPASLVFWPVSSLSGDNTSSRVVRAMTQLTIRQGCAVLARGRLTYRIEGREHLPAQGPVVIVARHYHHFYDGCILLNTVPRPLHLMIGLDWITRPALRWFMEQLCTLAQWPVVLRADRLRHLPAGTSSAYQAREAVPYLRRAVVLMLQVLRQGEVLVIFPEAYPAIDPHPTPREPEHAFGAFRPGFAHLIERVEHGGFTVPVLPAGLSYEHTNGWHATLRFGQPRVLADFTDSAALLHAVEQDVQRLSQPGAQSSADVPIRKKETPTR